MEPMNPVHSANESFPQVHVTVHYSSSGPSLQNCMTTLLQSHMYQVQKNQPIWQRGV